MECQEQKSECLKDKINELVKPSNNDIEDLCKGVYELKHDYQPRTNLMNDASSCLLVGCHNIFSGWKNCCCQPLNIQTLMVLGRWK
jgi:hypothetical protein